MTDERFMNNLGQPNSKSLYIALHQVANETEINIRNECLKELKLTGTITPWSNK